MYQVHIYEFIKYLHSSFYGDYLLTFSDYFSDTFNTEKMAIIMFLFSFFLYIFGKKYNSKFILLNYVFALGVVYILKYVIDKPRSPMILVIEHGNAFPSGHTAIAMTSSLLIFYYIRFIRDRFVKYSLFVFAILFTPLMAFSRIYLYAHDLYDVFASIFISGLLFFILYRSRRVISKIYIPFIDKVIEKHRIKVVSKFKRYK